MSASAESHVEGGGVAGGSRLQRLPPWMRPRDAEQRGRGELRLIEIAVLVLVGLLLAVATVNDVVRQSHINDRLVADLQTWRSRTGHHYHNLSISQQVLGVTSKREVVCGNTSPGPPRARIQLCLAIGGPVHEGRRTVQGGWYLPPKSDDQRRDRYACFGTAVAARLCPAVPLKGAR